MWLESLGQHARCIPDNFRKVLPPISHHQRAIRIHGITMKLRGLEMNDFAALQPGSTPARPITEIGNGENVDATRLQYAFDFGESALRLKDMLKDILADSHIKRTVLECQRADIFIAITSNHLTRLPFRKICRTHIAPHLPLKSCRHCSVRSYFENGSLAPAGHHLSKHRPQCPSAG